MTRRNWIAAGLLAGLALAVRLAVLRQLPLPELGGDALNYTRMANQLLTRHIYGYLGLRPDAYVTPGYPLFLAAIQWFAGGASASLAAVRVAQAMLGALTLLPFYLLARDVAGDRAAVWSGLMLVFYPSWVRAPAYLLTETLFTFVFGWYLWAQVRALLQLETVDAALPGDGLSSQVRRPRWAWPLAAGALLGLAVFVRPAVAPLLVLPWIYALIRGARRGRVTRAEAPSTLRVATAAAVVRAFVMSPAVRAFAVSAAGFVLVLLPWWIRNVVALHRLVLLATQTGNPLLGGMDPYGLWHGSLWAGVGPDTGHQLTKAVSILFWLLRHYPWLTLKWFTVGKFSLIFLSPWLGWELPTLSQVHYPVMILGWLGAMAALWSGLPCVGPAGGRTGADLLNAGRAVVASSNDRSSGEQFLSLALVTLTVIQLAFIPESRYAYPLVGILAVFGGIALTRIFAGGEADVPALAGRGTGVQRG